MKRRNASQRQGAAALPSMSVLLDAACGDARFKGHARSEIKASLARSLDDVRTAVLRGHEKGASGSLDGVLSAAADQLTSRRRGRTGRVINATGVVLHTGLGRAPLCRDAVDAVIAAAGYCNLEFDLESGERGRRASHAEDMLCRLTGAEAAMVVNNNAAATLLVLAALAGGREVIVSRGQLIEIGGSYRLPDVMACSGCLMREVGTTNKTRVRDYEAAITDRTTLLLHVHTSNYRIAGFTEAPDTRALVELARRRGLLVYDDLGSGAMFADELWQRAAEPTVTDSVAAGADVLSFSGDKLLGGPQAGLILSRRDLIERLRRHPMARALRIDKLTIASLEATLQLYFDPQRAAREIPALRLLHQPLDELKRRAKRLRGKLAQATTNQTFEIVDTDAYAGGGSLPAWPLPTAAVRWGLPHGASADAVARSLRTGTPPVISRIERGAILFDVRTLPDDELDIVAGAVRAAAESSP